MLMLFKSEYLPPTDASVPRIEFIIACNKALDADVSEVSAFSPSDAFFMDDACAAVIPTTSKFSVNVVNSSPALPNVSNASFKLYTLSLQEQRRYVSFFNWQNWSMHVKYAFLHCSYSAPVRVCDIALVVVARAVTAGVALRGVLIVCDVVLRGVAVRAFVVAVRAVIFCVVRDCEFCAGRRTLLRCVALRLIGCVETTRCVADAVRAVVLPSRIAASECATDSI